MWIKRLDAVERAITQDEGLRTTEGLLQGHLHSAFFFLGIWSIVTDWKPTGQLLTDKSDGLPSSHSGTTQICPLGVKRASNITQPYDLSTPNETSSHCDGWLFVDGPNRMIYREL